MDKKVFIEELLEYYEREFGEDEYYKSENYENVTLFNLAYTTSEDDKDEYTLDYDFESKKLIWKTNDVVVAEEETEPDDLFDWIEFSEIHKHCYDVD
ncbi:MAG: hypothetical protein ACRCX2_13260 [Paraclostridium sp.]